MAVVSDYNSGDLLTSGGNGEGGEDVVQDLSINEEVVKTLNAFAYMQDLEPNWDGEGAEPLSPALLNHTRELVLKLEQQPLSILPTADNSIFMAWFKETGSMNMEFLADGNVELVLDDDLHEELETFFPATQENLTMFVEGFFNNRNFLEG